MILHFWYSPSYEANINCLPGMTTPLCKVNDVVQSYSYMNKDRNCTIPPSLRRYLDLRYLGSGYCVGNVK